MGDHKRVSKQKRCQEAELSNIKDTTNKDISKRSINSLLKKQGWKQRALKVVRIKKLEQTAGEVSKPTTDVDQKSKPSTNEQVK